MHRADGIDAVLDFLQHALDVWIVEAARLQAHQTGNDRQ